MSGVVPLNLVKSVVDPIHGLIRMTREEHDLMNSRVFQRLRGIKQNGLLHLVFPSATHTRFEHSLGVMFVADAILQALYFNSEAERNKGLSKEALPDPRCAAAGLAVDFSRVQPQVLEDIFRVTRLAALVHDMGHGPLSHTFDKFAPDCARVRALIGADEFKQLAPLDKALFGDKKADGERNPVAHESMSCLMFCWHWSQHGSKNSDWIPLAVATAVLGRKKVTTVPDRIPSRLRKWLPLIQDIISSAPVDADRLDYVERDSRSCGVNYGLYDRNRLLKSALCYRSEADAFRLGWKLSGLRAIEVFLQARFQMFAQIYYHKTNSALHEMIETIREFLDKGDYEIFPAETVDELIGSYCGDSDDSFLRALCGEGHRLRDIPDINNLARRIAERQSLYRRLYETSPSMTAERMSAALRAARPDTNNSIRFAKSRLEATKDLEKGAVLLRRGSDGRYAAPRLDNTRDKDAGEDWREASSLIRTLHDEEKRIERLYWIGTDDNEYRDLRGMVLSISGAQHGQRVSTSER